MRTFLLCFLSLLLGAGCSTVAQELKDGTLYKRDINLVVNGVAGIGGVIVPKAASYQISAKTNEEGNFDFVIFETCGKYYSPVPEDQGDDFKTVFTPRVGKEDHGACPIFIHSFDKDHSRDAWGFIAFKSPEFNLPATLECNDRAALTDTVTYCENKGSLDDPKKVWITFSEPVFWGSSPKTPQCVLTDPPDGRSFAFYQPHGNCQLLFQSKIDPTKKHLLYTYGIDEILPRKF